MCFPIDPRPKIMTMSFRFFFITPIVLVDRLRKALSRSIKEQNNLRSNENDQLSFLSLIEKCRIHEKWRHHSLILWEKKIFNLYFFLLNTIFSFEANKSKWYRSQWGEWWIFLSVIRRHRFHRSVMVALRIKATRTLDGIESTTNRWMFRYETICRWIKWRWSSTELLWKFKTIVSYQVTRYNS